MFVKSAIQVIKNVWGNWRSAVKEKLVYGDFVLCAMQTSYLFLQLD